MRLGERGDTALRVVRPSGKTLPGITAGGGWKLRPTWEQARVETEAGWGGGVRRRGGARRPVCYCAEHSGSYSLAGRGGRRVRMLGSAELPAER